MSGNGQTMSFDAMIQADRKKRKNQELADKLLGKGRRSSVPNAALNRKSGVGGSLASRVGVNKKSTQSPRPSIDGQWTHDLHKPGPKRTQSSSRVERSTKLVNAIEKDATVNNGNPQFNIRTQATSTQMSIRGRAHPGPFCVVATNFAMGTTAADIEMAFQPHGEDLLSCKVVSYKPQVTAEAVFTKKESAENIVNVFNNSMADGNLLYVFIKPGAPSAIHKLDEKPKPKTSSTPPPAESVSQHTDEADTASQEQPKYEEPVAVVSSKEDVVMDEDESPTDRSYRDEGRLGRENYDREGPREQSRYQSNGYAAGRYGFPDSYDRRPRPDYRPSYGPRPRYDDRSWRGGPRWR